MMAKLLSDADTLRRNQQRRYLQAQEDLRRHQRANAYKRLLLLAAIIGLVGSGLNFFHLLQA